MSDSQNNKNDGLPEKINIKQLSKEEIIVGKLVGDIEHEPDMMQTVKAVKKMPKNQKEEEEKKEDFNEKSVEFVKVKDSCIQECSKN